MATTFKNFLSNDIANTRTLLHEAIPITGSIVSGTYAENNIKTYGHGMFSSVYDYPYLSSSANHIFDSTVGLANTSPLSASTTSQLSKKLNIYNQMAQYLVGYDQTGSIKKFTMPTTNAQMHSCYFVPLAPPAIMLIRQPANMASCTPPHRLATPPWWTGRIRQQGSSLPPACCTIRPVLQSYLVLFSIRLVAAACSRI